MLKAMWHEGGQAGRQVGSQAGRQAGRPGKERGKERREGQAAVHLHCLGQVPCMHLHSAIACCMLKQPCTHHPHPISAPPPSLPPCHPPCHANCSKDSPQSLGYPPVEPLSAATSSNPSTAEEGTGIHPEQKPEVIQQLVNDVLRNPYIWGMVGEGAVAVEAFCGRLERVGG